MQSSAMLLIWYFRPPNNFTAPISSNYWIMDTDYDNYAIIYSCKNISQSKSAEAAWVLSKQRTISSEVQPTVDYLVDQYLSRSDMRITEQSQSKFVLVHFFTETLNYFNEISSIFLSFSYFFPVLVHQMQIAAHWTKLVLIDRENFQLWRFLSSTASSAKRKSETRWRLLGRSTSQLRKKAFLFLTALQRHRRVFEPILPNRKERWTFSANKNLLVYWSLSHLQFWGWMWIRNRTIQLSLEMQFTFRWICSHSLH